MGRKITKEILDTYRAYLYEEEKSAATIDKYMCDLKKLQVFAGGRELSKSLVIAYKESLRGEGRYKTSSINSFLVAANRLFEYLGWYDLRIKTFKIQKELFVPEDRELSKDEYKTLVRVAKEEGNERLALILQTICATGIRVSELSAVTGTAVRNGVATIYNKGKERQVLFPRYLQAKLLQYMKRLGLEQGIIFRTSRGRSVDRTNIWREMKGLCQKSGINPKKVFPHNLRHLFARTFYRMDKDIAKLADILGHNSIETTRIYLKESYRTYREQLERIELLI